MIRFLRRFPYIFVLCCVPLFFAGFAFAEDDPTADDFDNVEHVLIAYHGDTAHVVIPSDVIAIGDEAFAHNGSVLSVVIPEGCTAVGNLAFFDCANLKSVALPASLISIGANGFNATGLTSVQLPGDLISIGESAFFQCSALSSMDIPDSVESIGADAFRWSGIEYLIVGHETTAEAYAIENSIPYQYRGTEEILYPPEFVIVDGVLKAYNGDGGSILLIPEGVQAIGEEAFNKHVEIEEIVIPEGVTEIRAGAFFGLLCLKEVSFPSTLTVIADNAFYACKLIDINLPEDLTTIGRNAFYDHNCANEIYIPSSVQFIGEGAFRSLQLHPVLVVEEDSEGVEYALDDGLAYRILGEVNIVYPPEFVIDSAGVLTRYNGDGGAVSIPDTVRVIADEVFYDNNSITAVTIPEGVERIGSYSFFGCMQLTELHIPSTVTYLAPDSFACCYGLKSLTFAEGITEIGAASFRVCDALEWITFPGTLQVIGERAFEQIPSVESIVFRGTVQEWNAVSIGSQNDCLTGAEIVFPSDLAISDLIRISIDRNEMSPGETVTATVEVFSDKLTIMDALWWNGRDGDYGGSRAVEIKEGKTVTAFQPYLSGTCWFEISYMMPDDTVYSVKSEEVSIAGVELQVSVSGGDGDGFSVGEPIEVQYSVTGAGEDVHVEFWWDISSVNRSGGTQIGKTITDDLSGTFTYVPGEQVEYVQYTIRVVDSNHFMFAEAYDSISISGGHDVDLSSYITIELDQPVISPGDSVRAYIDYTDKVFSVIEAMWWTGDEDGCSGSLCDLNADLIEFTPYISGDVWLQVSFLDSQGELHVARSEKTMVAGADLDLAFSGAVIEDRYIHQGSSITIDYTVSGGNQNQSVELWWNIFIKDSTGSLESGRTVANDMSGSATLFVNDTMEEIQFNIRVVDDNHFTYAEKNESFRILNHFMEYVPAQEPTLSTPGFTESFFCPYCGEVLSSPETIPALNDMDVLYLPENIEVIENEAFSGLACEAVIIPEGCTKIGERVFENCPNLKYIKIPSTAADISEDLFYLEDVYLFFASDD